MRTEFGIHQRLESCVATHSFEVFSESIPAVLRSVLSLLRIFQALPADLSQVHPHDILEGGEGIGQATVEFLFYHSLENGPLRSTRYGH